MTTATNFTADITQYLRPTGRQQAVTTLLPSQVHDAYMDMQRSGCRLEAEVLTTGEVSVTIFNPKDEVDVDIEVIPNGPRVPAALIAMLDRRLWNIAALDALEGGE